MEYQDCINHIVDLAVSASREVKNPDPVTRLYYVLQDINGKISKRMNEMREVERILKEGR